MFDLSLTPRSRFVMNDERLGGIHLSILAFITEVVMCELFFTGTFCLCPSVEPKPGECALSRWSNCCTSGVGLVVVKCKHTHTHTHSQIQDSQTMSNMVLWSDETKIELFGLNAICHTWRKHGGGSIMLWGCFSAAGRLVRIEER